MPADPHRAVILRRIMAVDGPARVTVTLDVRAGFGRSPMTDLSKTGGCWTGRSGRLRFRWSGAARARPGDDGLSFTVTLPAGGQHDLVLELSDRALDAEPPDPDRTWAATEEAWSEVVPVCDDLAAPRDARHAYAVLRGLTSGTGAMVAAATTSLPERLEGGRNYDYRYAWIRDQCYAGLAVAAHGPHPLLDGSVRFVTERLLADGPVKRVDLARALAAHGLTLRGLKYAQKALGVARTREGRGKRAAVAGATRVRHDADMTVTAIAATAPVGAAIGPRQSARFWYCRYGSAA